MTIDHTALRELAGLATAGPWDYYGGTATYCLNAVRGPYKNFRVCGNDTDVLGAPLPQNPMRHTEATMKFSAGNAGIFNLEDARFIAAANPATVLTLLDERATLLGRIAALEAALERIAYPEYGIGFQGLRKVAREALYGKGRGKPGGNKACADAARAAHPKSGAQA